MRYQPIYDIAALCARKNVKHVVLCPGSRCAPLTLAFARHPDIRTTTFSDERSAGFVALGMAQATGTPTAVVCTSGTAAYNLAPAIAEACFSHTPLIVITADRPAEWIAQHDGQTIYQAEMYGPHVKKYFQLPQDYDHADSTWAVNRMVNDAINLSLQFPRGPVHINAPFREPLYPETGEAITFSENPRVIGTIPTSAPADEGMAETVREAWPSFHRVLVVAGQDISPTEEIRDALQAFGSRHAVPVVHDILSNLHALEHTVRHADLFLGQASESLKKSLKPDLLITFGQSLISKHLKIFLRKHPPARHWHIQPAGTVADTFKNVTDVFHCTPASFMRLLTTLPAHDTFHQKQNNFSHLWEVEERRILRVLKEFSDSPERSELAMVRHLIENLPQSCNLHLANSMSVRYANFIGLGADKKGVRVFSNRGTSGIDGCTSTVVGHSLVSEGLHVLITGDLAFFYDRNAFWHQYPLPNVRILLLNNHGGLIFDVLDGPSSMPEAREYFITRQSLNAARLCEEFGFEYFRAEHPGKIESQFRDFLAPGKGVKVMEIETDTASGKAALEKLKQQIKNSYER